MLVYNDSVQELRQSKSTTLHPNNYLLLDRGELMRPRISLAVLFVTLLLISGLVIGCTRARSDAQIASDVQSKIQTDGNVQNKQLTVQSSNGVVVLSGTVSSELERTAAANDAGQVAGVKSVINNLTVAPASAQQAMPEPEQAAASAPAEPPPAYHRAARRSSNSGITPGVRRSTRESSAAAPSAPASYDSSAASAPAPAPVRTVTVPDGTQISVRLIDAVDSEVNQAGDTFRASLAQPVSLDGGIVIPANADIEGRVVDVKSAGHFKGQSLLALELTRLTMNGKSYELRTNEWRKEGSSRGKNTAAKVGGGAAVGALIGGLIGGGKGAAVGATVGAGAGTGVQAATKGQQIKLPSETVLNFQLTNPVTVVPATSTGRRNRVE